MGHENCLQKILSGGRKSDIRAEDICSVSYCGQLSRFAYILLIARIWGCANHHGISQDL